MTTFNESEYRKADELFADIRQKRKKKNQNKMSAALMIFYYNVLTGIFSGLPELSVFREFSSISSFMSHYFPCCSNLPLFIFFSSTDENISSKD